jgi:hypothetical protein
MKRSAITIAVSITALVLIFTASWASPSINNNFSGTWQLDAKRSQSPHFGEPVGKVTLIIKQTASTISIETRRGSQRETLTYKLDGSEMTQEAQENGPVSWRARWENDKLVTESTRNVNGSAVVVQEIRTLALNGKEMTVDRTLAVQHGYGSGNNTSTAKDVFIKAL